MSIYDFSVKDINGHDVSLKAFEGKVVLIVNTATACGYTPQYTGLQKLYNDFQKKGFEILDFPCNQFGHQAPGTEEQINDFCILNYKTTFPRFAKIEVNGKNESPLYTYLKSQKDGLDGSAKIRWNFTKFLINKKGNVVERYDSKIKPGDIESDIKKLLDE